MAETKYGKYVITYDKEPNKMSPGPVMAYLDDAVVKGSNFYLVHWMLPPDSRHQKELVSSMTSTPKGADRYSALTNHPMGGHPPHIHKDAELLFHIGTNPEDPMDLGAEVVMYMGPEMEKHVITKTCVIFIPPNFIHCPWRPVKIWRPWIFIQVKQGPGHSEKSYRQLLPRDLRETVDYGKTWPGPDVGY